MFKVNEGHRSRSINRIKRFLEYFKQKNFRQGISYKRRVCLAKVVSAVIYWQDDGTMEESIVNI